MLAPAIASVVNNIISQYIARFCSYHITQYEDIWYCRNNIWQYHIGNIASILPIPTIWDLRRRCLAVASTQSSNQAVPPALYQDFKHSNASTASQPSLFLLSVMVTLAPLDRRSGSADNAGIDSKSKAIRLKFGTLGRLYAASPPSATLLRQLPACKVLDNTWYTHPGWLAVVAFAVSKLQDQ